MSEIRVTAILRIKDNMLEEFKEYCSMLVKKVREAEAESTITYQFYLDGSDPTICFAHEVYEDAEAFSKHVENMSAMGATHEHLFSIEKFDICGHLPSDLARGMREFSEATNINYTNFPYMCATI